MSLPTYFRCPSCRLYYNSDGPDDESQPGHGESLEVIEHYFGSHGWEQEEDRECGCNSRYLEDLDADNRPVRRYYDGRVELIDPNRDAYDDMGIFTDYMGVQYREGQEAFEKGLPKSANPYEAGSEMAGAWADGWEYAVTMTRMDISHR